MRRKKMGFTLVELLTVLAIITMLIGLLVPSMAAVRRLAKETKQKAQLNTIGLALTAFRDDYGDYPPSDDLGNYTGGQKLAEALLGYDLLGFHPDSIWDAAGTAYEIGIGEGRMGHYLENGTDNAFRLDTLFADPTPLVPNTYVICDIFGVKQIDLGAKIVKAGTPILYYQANTSSKTIGFTDPLDESSWKLNIYNFSDNMRLINEVEEDPVMGTGQPLADGAGALNFFYGDYIKDPKVMATDWPYRPGSFLLISAGVDGLYGTADDITNFGN